MQKRLLISFMLSANLLYGCADDLARAQLADINIRLNQIEQTVGVLGNKVSNQKVLDVLNKLDDLQNQIDQLNGNLTNLQHDQQNFQNTQQQFNQGIEQQLQVINNKTLSSKNLSNDVEKAKLKIALQKIKAHEFNTAISQLKNLVNTSKDKTIIASANYYLVLAYAANGQYKNSIFTARQFVADNPDNENVPDALFTMYVSQQQLGMKKSADNTAKQIKSRYPNSSAAKKL